MRPNVLLREAIPEDASCLAALAAQTWLHTYATQGIRPTIARYVHEHLTPAVLRSQIGRPDAVTLVAASDDHLVGFAVLEVGRQCPAHDASAHLDKLFVQEHFWGQGVGSKLLQRVKTHAKVCGDESGIWLTVNSRNERARAFYKKQGFNDVGITDFDLYGEKHENHILHTPAA